MTKIIYTDYLLSSTQISLDTCIENSIYYTMPTDKLAFTKFKDEFAEQSGISKISSFSGEKRLPLFERTISEMLSKTKIEPSAIKYIIFTNPVDQKEDNVNIPYYLASTFKMNNATVVTLNQQCASSVIAIDLANAYLTNKQEDSHVLIISSSFIENDNERFINFTALGDGIGVLLMSNNSKNIEGFELVDYQPYSDGTFSSLASKGIIEYKTSPEERIEFVKQGSKLLISILEKNNIPKDKITVIPQNVNKLGETFYSEFSGIPREMFYTKNISKGAHIGDVDMIRNLTDFWKESNLSTTNVLLYAIGSDGTDINYSPMIIKKQLLKKDNK